MRRKNRFRRGVLLGAALAYFLDPKLGRRRRTVGRDRTLGQIRHAGRVVRRRGRYLASQARGKWQRYQHRHSGPRPQPDDATLAHKVETTIFRDANVPKGQISVNAEFGIVYLRGEVPEQSMLDDLVAKTRGVEGVLSVESLLHLPGEDVPMKQAWGSRTDV